DDPRRDHQPHRPRRVELLHELFERRRGPLDVGVERLHVVTCRLQALGHVRAHPAEAYHPELHYGSSSLILAPRRPRSLSVSRSPAACARISRRKPNGLPGIGSSSPSSSTSWRKRPVLGPPLCSCPVECWYRGPYPCVTTSPLSERSRSASSAMRRSFAGVGSIKAWIQ